jgi:aminoglycoside 6-adenylyltransferase
LCYDWTLGAIVSWGTTPCIGVDYQFRMDTATALDFVEGYLKQGLQHAQRGEVESFTAGYERLIGRLVAWAGREENVRVVFAIGSRARADRPADEWADLDLILVARDPTPYLAGAGWLDEIGTPWLTFLERTPEGIAYERRVLFEGGLDVDLIPRSLASFEQMLQEGLPQLEATMLRGGVLVLVDKEDLAARLAAAGSAQPGAAPPTELDFAEAVNDFAYHTVWTAKKLRRGELWWAKSCCDRYLKDLLLRMIEWHARAGSAKARGRGRFLEEWADPRVLAALPDAFASYDSEDVWRALFATMDLYRWLAVETATQLGYPYPSPGVDRAAALVRRLFSQRT